MNLNHFVPKYHPKIPSQNTILKYHPKISSRGRWKGLLLTWLKVFLHSKDKVPVKNPPTWKKQVVATEGAPKVLNVLAYPMKCRALQWLWQIPLGNPVVPDDKVIYPKYSKHWLSTVAHTINCVCSRILNHGLNHGLLFSLFKFFEWKNYINLKIQD